MSAGKGSKPRPVDGDKYRQNFDRIFRKGTWWCNIHQRKATHIGRHGEHRCDPKLGGIMMPCQAVFAKAQFFADTEDPVFDGEGTKGKRPVLPNLNQESDGE